MACRISARVARPASPAGLRIVLLVTLTMAVLVLMVAQLASRARADDLDPDDAWVVAQVAGEAYVARGDGPAPAWTPLLGGEVLQESAVVGTGPSGTMVLTHGQDILRLAANSIVSLADTGSVGDGTRLVQRFGRIMLDVQSRPGWNFQVDTPYLTAVVKGTSFGVSVGPDGAAVSVDQGTVGVSDRAGHSADLGPGERGHVGSAAGSGLSIGRADGTALIGRGVDSAAQSGAQPAGGVTSPAAAGDGAKSAASGSDSSGSGGIGSDGGATGASGGGKSDGGNGKAKGPSGDSPGKSGTAPGKSGDAPGKSGTAPGKSGDAPGQSGTAPGKSGDAPGKSGDSNGNGGGNGKAKGQGKGNAD